MTPDGRSPRSELDKVPFLNQFIDTIKGHWEATEFIIKYRPWSGFWNYGWVSSLLLSLAILSGFKFFNVFMNWFEQFKSHENTNSFVEMGLLFESMALESYNFLFSGSIKYIMLILLEVVIFHLCRRTMEILSKEESKPTFKEFLKAQIRMIKAVFRTYILEMIFTALIKFSFNMLDAYAFLEPAFIFTVQCYFLGFLVIDNYNEQFHLSIKDSAKYTKQFAGVAIAIGLVLNVFLLIPLIGPIVGPMIAAVTVTLIMYRISDLHLEYADLSDESLLNDS